MIGNAASRSLRAGLVTGVLSALVGGALLAPSVASAEKFTTPYNHPELKWYTIETEHFFVHYPVSQGKNPKHPVDGTWAARKMATVADEMWEPMCREFDFYLTEKVNIVLLEVPDDLEGFTIPAWDWIEISANPGGDFYRMRGRMEWFADVLVHEFAHVVSLKRNAAQAETMQGILVGGLFSDGVNDMDNAAEVFFGDTDPFWWTEGGAEYWSDNTGYNWWTPSRDANIRNTVLEDRLLTYDEWITRMEKRDWGDGERGYQQGYSFALYLRERFGDKTYANFAHKSSERWRPNWETIVEDVTGVPLKVLYDDWVVYLKERYGKVQADVIAEGEVKGREILWRPVEWEYTDPSGRDAWLKKPKRDREDEIENGGGAWDMNARLSDDGRWFAEHQRGWAAVYPLDESTFSAVAGAAFDTKANADHVRVATDMGVGLPMAWGHALDFIPGRDALVVTGHEEMIRSPFHVETDGYDWKQLYVVDLTPRDEKRKHKRGKETYGTLEDKMFLGKSAYNEPKRYTVIPNTMRGTEPAVSPDGTRVAYLEYGDGTMNLVVIDLDGNNKRRLTSFHDGTWMQNPDWSPDGKQIVLGLFRNYQQDLYVADVETGELSALNHDRWEDLDPYWGKDGWIYFSSDASGIFNIYRMHPETRQTQQITNVIGGAQMGTLTPDGNLLYTAWTAHGWKNYALAADEFLLKTVDAFEVAPDQEAVRAELAFSEDLSYWAEKTKPYNSVKHLMTPTLIPIFRFENDSRTNLGLSAGLQFFAMDFVENHSMFGYALLGEDPLIVGGYTFNGWAPQIDFFFQHYEAKFDYGLLLDNDNDLGTLYDQTYWEQKQNQYVNVGVGRISYSLNPVWNVGLSGVALEYGFQGVADQKFAPYLRSGAVTLDMTFSSAYGGAYSANVRGGRYVTMAASHEFSDIVYAPYGGRDTDDGQIMDAVAFNRVEVNWSEFFPAPTFGIEALEFIKKRKHTLQVNARVGLTDRNVHFQDEFRAGGAHPYYTGPGALQPNNQFSGYPGFSLSGETLIIVSAAYRFPVFTAINKKMGPLYVYDLHAQVGGTAGNLWSYRPPEEGDPSKYYYDGFGQRVAYDPSDVTREIPFLDEAYKNGNRILFDANAELRLSTTLMGMPWASFARVAYGFNEIRGINDVDGDDISDTTDPGTGNSVSQETEKPGPRIFLGIGTGW